MSHYICKYTQDLYNSRQKHPSKETGKTIEAKSTLSINYGAGSGGGKVKGEPTKKLERRRWSVE